MTTKSIPVTKHTPLTLLARSEAIEIVAQMLGQVASNEAPVDITVLAHLISASSYLSGFINGMALALTVPDIADKLLGRHLTPEQREVTAANMRSFQHQLAEWVVEPIRGTTDAGAGAGSSGLR